MRRQILFVGVLSLCFIANDTRFSSILVRTYKALNSRMLERNSIFGRVVFSKFDVAQFRYLDIVHGGER